MVKAREMLEQFSDFKIDAEKVGAVSIYQEEDGKREDVALIYRNDETTVQMNARAYAGIPQPNKYKFHDVIKKIQKTIEENRK